VEVHEFELLIVSVWLVDPIGGTFVDWPPVLEDGCLYSPSQLQEVLCSDVLRKHGCHTLASLGASLPDAWISHEELSDLEDDLLTASRLAEEVAHCVGIPLERFIGSLEKLSKACQFAGPLDGAGIYVG
jgi:hypothetical protein